MSIIKYEDIFKHTHSDEAVHTLLASINIELRGYIFELIKRYIYGEKLYNAFFEYNTRGKQFDREVDYKMYVQHLFCNIVKDIDVTTCDDPKCFFNHIYQSTQFKLCDNCDKDLENYVTMYKIMYMRLLARYSTEEYDNPIHVIEFPMIIYYMYEYSEVSIGYYTIYLGSLASKIKIKLEQIYNSYGNLLGMEYVEFYNIFKSYVEDAHDIFQALLFCYMPFLEHAINMKIVSNVFSDIFIDKNIGIKYYKQNCPVKCDNIMFDICKSFACTLDKYDDIDIFIDNYLEIYYRITLEAGESTYDTFIDCIDNKNYYVNAYSYDAYTKDNYCMFAKIAIRHIRTIHAVQDNNKLKNIIKEIIKCNPDENIRNTVKELAKNKNISHAR